MANNNISPTTATVSLVAKTYYEYSCAVEIVGKAPNPEDLQRIADEIYELVDGGDYEPDEHNWDLVEATAEIEKDSKKSPRYRAAWDGEAFEIEEIEEIAE